MKWETRWKLANSLITILSGVMIATIVLALALGVMFYKDPITQYNNGIHADCGGSWDYDGFVITKNRSRYSYHCDRCGRSLVLDEWKK